ncbi:MAG TPA: dienelactone hydrolase family protein, partial [Kribbella sp.]|nr:dienelactone hydrolase family protein [Kribbella sp.]
MAKQVVLFHSALGLRAVEHRAARLLRADGHEVQLPDLYGGRVAADLDSGLSLMREVGWDAICGRARAAVRDLPDDTVLMGISMGAGVVGEIWKDHAAPDAVVLIHGHTAVPATASPRTRVELHAGSNDSFV